MKKEFILTPTKACEINGFKFKAGVQEKLSYGKADESNFTVEQFANYFSTREKTYKPYFKEDLEALMIDILAYLQNGKPDVTPTKEEKAVLVATKN